MKMPWSKEPEPLESVLPDGAVDSSALLTYTVAVLGTCVFLRKCPHGASDSVALLLFFVFWYVGNAFYNQYNTLAIGATGGKHGGLTMTVSTMQLGVCTLYAMLLWLANKNPIKLCGLQLAESMPFPAVNGKDIVSTLPVAFCSAAAHSAGVFCLGADPLFGQIVKARGAESASATAPFLTGRTGLE